MRTTNGPSFCPERRTWARQVRLVLVVLITGHRILAEPAFGQELQSDHPPAVVHGAVINAVTKQPIGRALVYSADHRYAMLTDSEGHFEFTVPKAAAVALSLAEVDPSFHEGHVLVADARDGQPLGKSGPFQLIVSDDNRPARWVRNLVSITLQRAP